MIIFLQNLHQLTTSYKLHVNFASGCEGIDYVFFSLLFSLRKYQEVQMSFRASVKQQVHICFASWCINVSSNLCYSVLVNFSKNDIFQNLQQLRTSYHHLHKHNGVFELAKISHTTDDLKFNYLYLILFFPKQVFKRRTHCLLFRGIFLVKGIILKTIILSTFFFLSWWTGDQALTVHLIQFSKTLLLWAQD